MAGKPTCLVCQKEMVRGFMTDCGSLNVIRLPRWCESDPQASGWSGEVSHEQLREGFAVVAFRCPECEALRLYAPSAQ